MKYTFFNALLLLSEQVGSIPLPGDLHIHIDGKDLKDVGRKSGSRINRDRNFSTFSVGESELGREMTHSSKKMTATKNRNIVNKGTFHDGFKQNDSRCEPSKNPNFINEAKAEIHGLVEQNINCKNMITGGAGEGTNYDYDYDVGGKTIDESEES